LPCNPDRSPKTPSCSPAHRGIGDALAYNLAGQAPVWPCPAATFRAWSAVAERCRDLGGQAVCLPADISEPDQCQELVARRCTYGRIDALVNNAGITMWARFDECKTDL
jgi:NAD(P)-dependent dehydrogenase (short-subunit alcohol dehydrogenase family)